MPYHCLSLVCILIALCPNLLNKVYYLALKVMPGTNNELLK